MQQIQSFIAGIDPLTLWLGAVMATGLLVGIFSGYFKARKIQPKGFRWRIFRNEIFFAALNLVVTGVILGAPMKFLQQHGVISFSHGPASPWIVLAQFALYFFAFDTYFYWLHRLMHIEPIYSWVHKIHHRSISPNPLTTLSVSPLESLINGGFVLLFTSVVTVHDSTMALITPANIIMG